ncbi:hypothetical protein AMK22_28690 [Streptomyces sp. CB01580]|nr:hypothetical protein AMK22_28690 [Streptomyces sp. CB01580]
MTEITSKYADFEGLRAQAVALRRQGLSRRQIRDRLFVGNNDILKRLSSGARRNDNEPNRRRRRKSGR